MCESKVPSERVSLTPGPCTNGYDVTPTEQGAAVFQILIFQMKGRALVMQVIDQVFSLSAIRQNILRVRDESRRVP